MPYTCGKCFRVPCICEQKSKASEIAALDFRAHACGECAWAKIIEHEAAYHPSIDKGEDAFVCRHRSSDLMWPVSIPACPAYIPKEVTS